MNKYKVISLHPTNVCDMNCPFCYRDKGKIKPNEKLFLGLPKYLNESISSWWGGVNSFPRIHKEIWRRM